MNRQLHRQTVDRTPFEAQVPADRQNIIVRRGSHGRIRRNGGKRLHLIEQRQTIDTPRLRAVESPYTQLRTGFERMIIHPHHPVMPEHLVKQLWFQTGVHHHQQFVTGILHIEQVGHLGNGIYVVANRRNSDKIGRIGNHAEHTGQQTTLVTRPQHLNYQPPDTHHDGNRHANRT